MWVELTPKLLKTHLAVAEVQALATVQVGITAIDTILADECKNIANAWRGRIRLFHAVDKRQNYVPESLLEYILCHLRYACYTRLPQMGNLLDELRRREWERANEVMDNIRKFFIDPVKEGEEEASNTGNPVIIVANDSWKFDTYCPRQSEPKPPTPDMTRLKTALDEYQRTAKPNSIYELTNSVIELANVIETNV